MDTPAAPWVTHGVLCHPCSEKAFPAVRREPPCFCPCPCPPRNCSLAAQPPACSNACGSSSPVQDSAFHFVELHEEHLCLPRFSCLALCQILISRPHGSHLVPLHVSYKQNPSLTQYHNSITCLCKWDDLSLDDVIHFTSPMRWEVIWKHLESL